MPPGTTPRRRPRGTALLLATVLLAARAGGILASPPDAPPQAAGAPVRVGSERDFHPYAFVDPDGRPAGFSVDLIEAVGHAMGLRLEISPGSWDEVWQGLADGRIETAVDWVRMEPRQ